MAVFCAPQLTVFIFHNLFVLRKYNQGWLEKASATMYIITSFSSIIGKLNSHDKLKTKFNGYKTVR